MARRIIIAVACTLVLLVAARRFSAGKPVDIDVDEGGCTIHHRTVAEQVGPGRPILSLRIAPSEGCVASVQLDSPLIGESPPRGMVPAGNNEFRLELPDLGKGKRLRYAITVGRADGTTIRLPRDPGEYFQIKYKGTASIIVLVLHIAAMFGAFFFMFMSFLGALRILRRREGKRSTVNAVRWVLVLSFFGGWPLGFILNYQTFGVLWEGYPFGYDITDNKTQVMFVLWLASLLLVAGSATGRGEEKDRLGPAAFAWAIIASFLVSLALFVLPHSI